MLAFTIGKGQIMNWLQSRKQRKKLKKAGISEEAYRLLYFLSIRQEAVDIHKLVREAGSFREQETLYSISMTEYTVSVARTLLAKDLIHFSNRKFSISGAGLALVNSAGPPSRRLKRNPFMSTETCSSTTILANMLVSLLLLGSGIICRGYTLFAAGFVLLMYIGSYLYTWWGIRTRRDSMVSVQLPFLYYVFGIALLVLSASGVTVSLPLDHNVFANRITILAIVLMTALSVYQRKIGSRYISFSLLSLSRDDYFEHMVDRALGELLFSHYCQIENDKFLHKK